MPPEDTPNSVRQEEAVTGSVIKGMIAVQVAPTPTPPPFNITCPPPQETSLVVWKNLLKSSAQRLKLFLSPTSINIPPSLLGRLPQNQFANIKHFSAPIYTFSFHYPPPKSLQDRDKVTPPTPKPSAMEIFSLDIALVEKSAAVYSVPITQYHVSLFTVSPLYGIRNKCTEH